MTTCLVTGGAGFIGSNIVDALLAQNRRVKVLDNLDTGKLENLAHVASRIEFIKGDLRDKEAVRGAVQGVDCVFHQAALASVPRSIENPIATHDACVTGTVNLLNEARQAGVRRVVYAGSSSAYGNSAWASKRETDLPGPLSPYAAAKLAAELYCRAFYESYGLETVVVRYFNVFGPRQDPNGPYAAVIPCFINQMLAGQAPQIYGDGQQSRDFTFVQNVVHGNLLASDAPHVGGQVFNLAMGQSTSLLNLIAALNKILGTSFTPRFADPRVGDVRDSLADISSAERVLKYAPSVSFLDGLGRTVEDLKQRR